MSDRTIHQASEADLLMQKGFYHQSAAATLAYQGGEPQKIAGQLRRAAQFFNAAADGLALAQEGGD